MILIKKMLFQEINNEELQTGGDELVVFDGPFFTSLP